jgi:peptidoglycan hydrolase CwlO-like protein
MIAKYNQEKRIDESMTIMELAIMVNRGFTALTNDMNTGFARLDDKINHIDTRLTRVEKKLDNLDVRLTHVEKKVTLIEKNIVSRYEFQALGLRTEVLEQTLKV